MSHIGDLSEREIVGIAKTLSSSAAVGRKSLDRLWSDLATYLVRTAWRNVSQEFMRLFRREIDGVLQRTWLGLKKNHVKLQTFLSSYDHILTWLFTEEDYAAVRGCSGRWSSCIPQLQRLSKRSELGELLFAFVYDLLNADALCEAISARFKSFNFAAVDGEAWRKLQHNLMDDMEAFKNSKALFCKRLGQDQLQRSHAVVPSTFAHERNAS